MNKIRRISSGVNSACKYAYYVCIYNNLNAICEMETYRCPRLVTIRCFVGNVTVHTLVGRHTTGVLLEARCGLWLWLEWGTWSVCDGYISDWWTGYWCWGCGRTD